MILVLDRYALMPPCWPTWRKPVYGTGPSASELHEAG